MDNTKYAFIGLLIIIVFLTGIFKLSEIGAKKEGKNT